MFELRGVGLAAPQVGVPLRLMLVCPSGEPGQEQVLINPQILVFDDSTSSVDTETEYLIQQALGELMKGRTTFVIAQRLRTVKAADQILVLDRGRIVDEKMKVTRETR